MLLHQNIFLIEDDTDDQIFFIQAIKKIDNYVKYTIAYDGVDALVKLKLLKHLPDIIFLDINMPRMNGFEFLKHLKAEKTFDQIPVIVLFTATGITEQVYRLGANACITKPASIFKLQSEIEKILTSVNTINNSA